MAVASALHDQDPARPICMAAGNDRHLPLRAKPLPNAGREKAGAAALGGMVLPDPAADRVAKDAGCRAAWSGAKHVTLLAFGNCFHVIDA